MCFMIDIYTCVFGQMFRSVHTFNMIFDIPITTAIMSS